MNSKTHASASVLSLLLSFLAASHHSLHMGIMLLMGGSMSMMTTMSTFVWLRRFMIAMTVLMTLFSFYRLYRHRCRRVSMWGVTVVSAAGSLAFLVYTLVQFGW